MNKTATLLMGLALGILSIFALFASFNALNTANENGDLIKITRADQLFVKGMEATNQQKVDRAAELFKESLELNPNVENAHYQLAFLLVSKEDREGAIIEAEKELKSYPNNAKAVTLIGTLHMLEGNKDEAEESLLRAIEIDPLQRDAVQNLSQLYREQEQASKSVEILTNYLALRPMDAFLQYKLQMSFISGGRVSRIVGPLQRRIDANKANAADYILAMAIQLANSNEKEAHAALSEALKRANTKDIERLLQDPFFKDYIETIKSFSQKNAAAAAAATAAPAKK